MTYIHNEIIHNKESSKIIFPLLLQYCSVSSMLDIGCGLGTWLSVAKELGINDVKGVDGNYVDRNLLTKYISVDEFVSHDLTLPLDLGKKFDLCLCVEVAEHLHEKHSEVLIDSLVKHSDCILFSAAIPGQGGQNHLNEQWPDYWANKFAHHGYVFLDLIRPLIWNSSLVDYWYKQNIFLVVKKDHALAQKYPSSCNSLVHPELFKRKEEMLQRRIESLERSLNVHPIKNWLKSLIKFQ